MQGGRSGNGFVQGRMATQHRGNSHVPDDDTHDAQPDNNEPLPANVDEALAHCG